MNVNGDRLRCSGPDRAATELTKSKSQDRPKAQNGAPGLAARRAALELLDAVLIDGQMLEDSRAQGDPAVRAEARGLADLTLRRLGQIDDLLSQFVNREPKGSGHQILRLMTAELAFKGTAPHAAVDLGVRLAQSGKQTSRMAGMVNAVGRKIAANAADLITGHEAAEMNTMPWLGHAMVQDWGEDTALAIAEAHLSPAPHDLTLKHDGDLEPLAAELKGHILPTGSLRLKDRPQLSALPGYETGAWWVQDAAAALPARLLGNVAGKSVLDLCAAPGGKTMQMAAAGAKVTALDISDHRLQRVSENLGRIDLSADVIAADLLRWEPDSPPDAIFLDAPCSATGTLRRHPDLAYRMTAKRLRDLRELQATMLDRAFTWLPENGTLVYCTCSVLKSEGENQIDAFLKRTPEAKVTPIQPDLVPTEFITKDGMMRTRPDQWADLGGLDGFFACCLQRSS